MKDVDDATLESELIPPPKAPKILVILLGLNVALTGFVAFKVLTLPPPTAASAEAEPAVDPNVPGPLLSLDPFVVNLNDPENPRFLKVKLDLELKSEEILAELDPNRMPIVRDDLMMYLSDLKLENIMGQEAKLKIKENLGARLAKHYGEGTVRRVLLTEIVIQ